MFDTFLLKDPDRLVEETKAEKIPLIPSSFAGLIVGPPGSGKSTLMGDMLYNVKALYKKFDYSLFLAPYREAFDIQIPDNRFNESLSIDWIYDRVANERDLRGITNCVVFIDDFVSSIAKSHMNPEMINLIFNRRKVVQGVEISLVFSTQKFTLFPAKFRSALQWIIAFNVSPEDWKIIKQQHIYNASPHFNSIVSSHFRKSYNFVFIKLDKAGLFLNFNKQI